MRPSPCKSCASSVVGSALSRDEFVFVTSKPMDSSMARTSTHRLLRTRCDTTPLSLVVVSVCVPSSSAIRRQMSSSPVPRCWRARVNGLKLAVDNTATHVSLKSLPPLRGAVLSQP